MTQDEIVHVPTVANLDQHHHVEQEVDFHVAHEKRRNYSDAKHNPLGGPDHQMCMSHHKKEETIHRLRRLTLPLHKDDTHKSRRRSNHPSPQKINIAPAQG